VGVATPLQSERHGGRRRRRIAVLVLVLAATLAVGAVLTWRFYVPRYRPSLRKGERYGIDVSRHQGIIDWARVADDRIAFAYLKATEGGDVIDRRFAINRTDATAAGIRIGAYHFFTFCRSGADQAANFLRIAPPARAMLPPAVDVEPGGNCSNPPSPDVVQAQFDEFVRIVESQWQQPMLVYALPGSIITDRSSTSSPAALRPPAVRHRWARRLFRRPRGRWEVWQVSGWAHVRGINGPVDLDIARAPF
jgi:lysozyme